VAVGSHLLREKEEEGGVGGERKQLRRRRRNADELLHASETGGKRGKNFSPKPTLLRIAQIRTRCNLGR